MLKYLRVFEYSVRPQTVTSALRERKLLQRWIVWLPKFSTDYFVQRYISRKIFMKIQSVDICEPNCGKNAISYSVEVNS